MKRSKHERRLNMLFAVLIAFSSWVYVIYTIDPATTKTIKAVPIEFTSQKELAQRNLAIKDSDVETVDVLIEGKRSKVGRIKPEDVRATVNLADAGKGENTISVQVSSPASVTATNRGASQAVVTVEDIAYKTVQSYVEYNNPIDLSNEPYVTEQTNRAFEVSGAKSLVGKVEYVGIQLNNEKVSDEPKAFSVKAIAMDSTDKPVKYINVEPGTASVTVMDSFVKNVDLKLDIDIPDNNKFQITYSAPTQVVIKGQADALSSITSVESMPISLDGIESSQDIPIEYNLPDGIQIANASREAVIHVKVIPYETKAIVFSTSDIEIKNLADEYGAEFSDTAVTVKITGLGVNIKPLTEEDFKLSLNARDMSEGTYQAEIKVDTDAPVYSTEIFGGAPYITIREK